MSLLSSVIVTFCVGTSGPNSTACSKALDAGTQQYGITDHVGLIEDRYSRWGEQQVDYTLGPTGKEYFGGAIFLLKTASEKTVIIPIPLGHIFKSLQTQFRPDSAMITCNWKF